MHQVDQLAQNYQNIHVRACVYGEIQLKRSHRTCTELLCQPESGELGLNRILVEQLEKENTKLKLPIHTDTGIRKIDKLIHKPRNTVLDRILNF